MGQPRRWRARNRFLSVGQHVISGSAKVKFQNRLLNKAPKLKTPPMDSDHPPETPLSHDRQFRLLVEAVSDYAIYMLDPTGKITSWNPGAQRFKGYEAFEIIGQNFSKFYTDEDQSAGEPQAGLDAAAKFGKFEKEGWRVRKDGGQFWAGVVLTAIRGDDGTLIGFAKITRDLTEARQTQTALEIARDALFQSQKMEAVGQLTGGIAHDFNNMLTAISGCLEMVQTRVSQGRINDLDKYLVGAQSAAKQASSLTHRLLAFSRQQTLSPKPTNINRLIAGMEDLVRRTVGPGVTVETVAGVGLWTNLVDAHQLESALLNLCINARDAMPQGGRLTIETANRWFDVMGASQLDLPPGQYVSLCVSDTGSGMTPEVLRRAFDPFFTTKPIGEGTGLGLSMIYGFARQSGGQVRIYSELGQGSMLCLYLPRHRGEADGVDVIVEPHDEPVAGLGETVLVVDDEPTVRMLIAEILREMGYPAIEAGDAAAALKVLQSDTRIDLLITDIGLPNGMNGRQLVDIARQSRPKLKVLFITGYAESAAIGDGLLEADMQVLTKPFALAQFASRVKDIIAQA